MLGEPDERTVIHAARPQAPGRTARKASWGLERRDERVIIGPGAWGLDCSVAKVGQKLLVFKSNSIFTFATEDVGC